MDSSGGLHLAFERAAAMGFESIQVHPTPPNYWGSPKLDDDRVEKFREAAAAAGNPPFYFHAVYLINLAGDDATLRQRSESTLAGYLAAADTLGISGVVFHTGSHKGAGFETRLPTITEHLKHVMERADPQQARLLIENNAGQGGCVGARFEEIRAMLDAVGDPRINACFDTCHAFASGYDERTPRQPARPWTTGRAWLGSTASRRCTATTPRPAWARTATATPTSGMARSARPGSRRYSRIPGWPRCRSSSRCPASTGAALTPATSRS